MGRGEKRSVCISRSNTHSPPSFTLLLLLCISTSPEWERDIPHTQAVRSPTDPPRSLSPPFMKDRQRCANYTDLYSWPPMSRPSSPPFSRFSLPSLSELLFLCSCHVAERGSRIRQTTLTLRHPLGHHGDPPRPPERGKNERPSLDGALCKWMRDVRGWTERSGRMLKSGRLV